MCSNLGSPTFLLCDLGQVSWPLCASISSSVNEANNRALQVRCEALLDSGKTVTASQHASYRSSIRSWTLLDNSVILSSSPPTVSPSFDDLASCFIEKVGVTGRECLQFPATKSAHLPACKPSYSTFFPLRGTTRLSPVLHLYCITNFFSLLDPSHRHSNLFFFYPIVLKKKSLAIPLPSSATAPFLTFISEQSIFHTCKYVCYYSLLNPLCWCFWPHDSTEYILIKDTDGIPATIPTGQFISCHWPISSLGHIWSLSPTSSPLSTWLPGLLPGLVVCLPSWLFHICFFAASFSSLWPLNIRGNQDSLNGLLFHPHPHFDEPIFLKALNTMYLKLLITPV